MQWNDVLLISGQKIIMEWCAQQNGQVASTASNNWEFLGETRARCGRDAGEMRAGENFHKFLQEETCLAFVNESRFSFLFCAKSEKLYWKKSVRKCREETFIECVHACDKCNIAFIACDKCDKCDIACDKCDIGQMRHIWYFYHTCDIASLLPCPHLLLIVHVVVVVVVPSPSIPRRGRRGGGVFELWPGDAIQPPTTRSLSPPPTTTAVNGQCGWVVRPTLKVAEVGGSCPCKKAPARVGASRRSS